jgi:hypothetical protein
MEQLIVDEVLRSPEPLRWKETPENGIAQSAQYTLVIPMPLSASMMRLDVIRADHLHERTRQMIEAILAYDATICQYGAGLLEIVFDEQTIPPLTMQLTVRAVPPVSEESPGAV